MSIFDLPTRNKSERMQPGFHEVDEQLRIAALAKGDKEYTGVVQILYTKPTQRDTVVLGEYDPDDLEDEVIGSTDDMNLCFLYLTVTFICADIETGVKVLMTNIADAGEDIIGPHCKMVRVDVVAVFEGVHVNVLESDNPVDA